MRREVEASRILGALGFQVVPYREDVFRGERVSVCDLIISKDLGLISAEDYLLYLWNKDIPVSQPESLIVSTETGKFHAPLQADIALEALRDSPELLPDISNLSGFQYGSFVSERAEVLLREIERTGQIGEHLRN